MSLALAQRKRRDFIGPMSPLTSVLLTGGQLLHLLLWKILQKNTT